MGLMRFFARAVFLELDLRSAAGDFDLRAVVQIVAARTLEPRHFAIIFGHDICPLSIVRGPLLPLLTQQRTTDH